MDRQLRTLLPSALGESQFVIAVNVDIRGFSEFSQRVESVEAAVFLRRAYIKMAEDYFGEATFFKLTGDGMLLVFSYADDDTLRTLSGSVFSSCFRLLTEFASLTADDPMVNFAVPERVGIGISRGAASRIYADETTLDYSGRVLNLASRLMNLARPTGIVFDTSFGLSLVPAEFTGAFSPVDVYLNGIAEMVPVPAMFTTELTSIPVSATQPIRKLIWHEQSVTEVFSDLTKLTRRYQALLDFEPLDPAQISVRVQHPAHTRTKVGRSQALIMDFSGFVHETDGERHWIDIRMDLLAEQLTIPPKPRAADEIEIQIRYPRK